MAAKTQTTQATKEAKSKPAQPKRAAASAVKPKRAAKATQPKAAQPKQATATAAKPKRATATAAKPKATAAKAPAKEAPQTQAAPSRTLHVKGVSTKAAKPQAAPEPPPSKPKAAAKLPAPLTLTRVGDYDNPTVDPAMIAPPDIVQVMRGKAKQIHEALRTGEGYTAFSDRKSKQWGYNVAALHWYHHGEYGISDYVLPAMYLISVDWAQRKAIVSGDPQSETIAELDLATSELTPLELVGIPRTRLHAANHLDQSRLTISAHKSLYLCERQGNTVTVSMVFPGITNTGFASMNGRLLFGGIRPRLLLGIDSSELRLLWRDEGAASMPDVRGGVFRFYTEGTCFELAGAEQLWEDCFVNGNREKYPIFQGV